MNNQQSTTQPNFNNNYFQKNSSQFNGNNNISPDRNEAINENDRNPIYQSTNNGNNSKGTGSQSQPFLQVNQYQTSPNSLTPPLHPPSSPPDRLLIGLNQQTMLEVKTQNLKRYNLRPDSPIYQFGYHSLYKLVNTYPQQFPPELQPQMKQTVDRCEHDYRFFNRAACVGIVYWILLKRKNWFKLTGNFPYRVTYLMFSVAGMMAALNAQNNYIVSQVFINSRSFEQIIRKYNIPPVI